MKRIIPREEYCTDCRLCEVYCSFRQSTEKDLVAAYRKGLLKNGRVRVSSRGPVSFAMQCRHCQEAPCVLACLAGAMGRERESGRVTHDPSRCVGCWTCIVVCPFGAIRRKGDGSGVVSKCDLCPDLAVPACVEHCPNGALVVVDLEGDG